MGRLLTHTSLAPAGAPSFLSASARGYFFLAAREYVLYIWKPNVEGRGRAARRARWGDLLPQCSRFQRTSEGACRRGASAAHGTATAGPTRGHALPGWAADGGSGFRAGAVRARARSTPTRCALPGAGQLSLLAPAVSGMASLAPVFVCFGGATSTLADLDALGAALLQRWSAAHNSVSLPG